MVAYSFKRRFVEPILAGTKAQTIRADRKRHARQGEQLQLYSGMRTKHCTLIGRAECTSVWPIRIEVSAGIIFANDGWIRAPSDLDAFAVSDGFRDFDEMVAFWRVEHPGRDVFEGVLIRWQPLAVVERSAA